MMSSTNTPSSREQQEQEQNNNNNNHQQPEREHSSGAYPPQKAPPISNNYTDPLDCDDDDDDVGTQATPVASRDTSLTSQKYQQQQQQQKQSPREVTISKENSKIEITPVMAQMPNTRPTVSQDSHKIVSDNGFKNQLSTEIKTFPIQKEVKQETSSVYASPLASKEGKSGTIPVEVTSDGVTRSEELDPRELARLYAQQQAALRSIRGEFDILYVPDWVRLHPLLGAYVAEAFGTFAFVLTLSLVQQRNRSIFDTGDDNNITALPIGFMFMSMIFTFGYISGGHFNPAVTMAVFLVRKIDIVRAVGYLICQTGASLGAGLVAMAIQGSTDIFVPQVDLEYVSSGIFSELIFTFAIAIVVLNVGYSRQSGNFFYGFAIGMTVAAGSASVGRISGGAFNPAAATGLELALCLTGSCEALSSFWVYWMAPLAGSVLAAALFSQMTQPGDTHPLTDAAVLRNTQPVEEAPAAEVVP